MNTYDFDKTIFYPDSSVTFIKHCFRKYPWIMLKNFPGVIPQAIAYAVNGGSAAKLKEKLRVLTAEGIYKVLQEMNLSGDEYERIAGRKKTMT